ncbi:hypothetical protein THICB3620162 [Thiomonas sp. CB3]|nr:hypothetical protein THICB3620162 [Thiomonas sp. CB3]
MIAGKLLTHPDFGCPWQKANLGLHSLDFGKFNVIASVLQRLHELTIRIFVKKCVFADIVRQQR